MQVLSPCNEAMWQKYTRNTQEIHKNPNNQNEKTITRNTLIESKHISKMMLRRIFAREKGKSVIILNKIKTGEAL